MSDVKDLIQPKRKKDITLSSAINKIKSKGNRVPLLNRKKIVQKIVEKKLKITSKELYNSLKFKTYKEDEFERSLRKLATKGVVKLFNTINKTKLSL